MKNLLSFIAGLALTITFSQAQTSSTATELAGKMTIGWNIGNSLEVPDGETAWGNPEVSQTLIDAVSDAGFNTIRIPCAWDSYADESTHEIDADWMSRVKEVVDYCYENDMYVILNAHWDGGWLEENPTYDSQDEVNEKQEAYWTQIAEYFADYDEHLLFAGTNEVHYDYNDPTDEYIEVQESYNQTFVDAVRATGGNNATRVLVVQTYNTNAWYGLNYFSLPDDDVDNKLIVEIHYYDPYNFTLNSDNSSACIVWGSPWSDGDVCSWGQEDYVDDLFDQVETKWVDNDVPVIIGEYGVINRTDLTGDDLTDHTESREYYLEYITSAAVEYNIIPIYWDNGAEEKGMALFDRSSGEVVDEGALNAIISGAGVDPDDNDDETTTATLTKHGSGSSTQSIELGDAIDDFYYSWEDATTVTVTGMPDGITTTIDTDEQTVSFTGTPTESGTFTFTVTTVGADENVSASGTITVTDGDEEEDDDEDVSTDFCDDPTSIDIPYSYSGAGEYCWVTTEEISYINSWGLNELTINGEDYTNTWSSSLPDAVDGQWTIYYNGSYAWSHFEAPATKSTGLASTFEVKIYPNPFTESITLDIDSPNLVNSISVRDFTGRVVKTYDKTAIGKNMVIGQELNPGIYIIQIYSDNQTKSYSVTKQ